KLANIKKAPNINNSYQSKVKLDKTKTISYDQKPANFSSTRGITKVENCYQDRTTIKIKETFE
ncbi:13441_t:CDS:1, partial [Gigaspora margarita]